MKYSAENYLKCKAEAARFLGVSVGSVDRLMRNGLAYVKVGGLVRFRPEDLTAYVDARTQNPHACVEVTRLEET
jgi:excisionase family DNA binding protein